MKRFLALALTLLMALSLCTVALAAIVPEEDMNPACEIGLTVGNETYNNHLQPGESYMLAPAEGDNHTNRFYMDMGNVSMMLVQPANADNPDQPGFPLPPPPPEPLPGDIVEQYVYPKDEWRASASWDVGGAMVKGIKWDDSIVMNEITAITYINGAYVLELNENYTISTPKVLKGTVTFTNKKNKNITVKYTIDEIVCNHLVTLSGYKKQADAEDNVIDAQDNTLYQCDEDNPGYLCFNDGRLLSCTLKMVKNEKAFMYNDEAMNDDLEEKYADSDARINCYAFGGSPKFQNDASFKLQADYADQYKVYTWDGKALHPQDFKWDSINGVYTWTTKSPTTYVISDKELVAGAETSGTAAEKTSKNPDTGARDIVGIAATLAVVSLIAAAAVNRRK